VINFNIFGINELIQKLDEFYTDNMLREIASDLKGEIKKRVHVRGEASDGSKIGVYSDGYMNVRTGNFKSKNIVRGKNKGGKRPAYNRKADRKVILSLTRQMENDLSVIKTTNGYGIGFNNSHNYNKAIWNEKRYGKPIWKPSKKEVRSAENIVEKYVREINS